MIDTEVKLSSKLREMMKTVCKSLHYQRIEASTILGIPDVNLACEGKDAWVELKIIRGTAPIVKFQQHQLPWWCKAALAQRRGCLLAYDIRNEQIRVAKFNLDIMDFVWHMNTLPYQPLDLKKHIFSSCLYED